MQHQGCHERGLEFQDGGSSQKKPTTTRSAHLRAWAQLVVTRCHNQDFTNHMAVYAAPSCRGGSRGAGKGGAQHLELLGVFGLQEHQVATRKVLNSPHFPVRWALITCALLQKLPFLNLKFAHRIGKRCYVGEYWLLPSRFPPFFSEWKETQLKLGKRAELQRRPQSRNLPEEGAPKRGRTRPLEAWPR